MFVRIIIRGWDRENGLHLKPIRIEINTRNIRVFVKRTGKRTIIIGQAEPMCKRLRSGIVLLGFRLDSDFAQLD